MIKVPLAIINASTLVDQEELLSVTSALQIQVHRDFSPAWKADADLAVVLPGEAPPTGAWWVVVMDNSDLGSALGYHDLTTQGLPLGKVFVETAKNAGQSWSVLLGHEILEMLADPYICLTALAPTAFGLCLYAYENCDACQSDKFAYTINDQLVPDFCLPDWFDANKVGSIGPFDFGRHMTQPFELVAGGYAMVRNLSTGGEWALVTASGAPIPYGMRPKVGSRRERRRSNFASWQNSTVTTGLEFDKAKVVRPGS